MSVDWMLRKANLIGVTSMSRPASVCLASSFLRPRSRRSLAQYHLTSVRIALRTVGLLYLYLA
jgi:hypothetical protein